MVMQFQRGDRSIDYSDDGEGLPVVLLHAFANDRTLWAPQIAAFRERYRVIAPTLRGFFGSSPVDGQAVSMDTYADDVVALLDHLAIGRAVIGGISLGGYVALSLALRHPARIAGLVLANTRATADDPQWASYREALVEEVEQRGAVAVIENYGDKPFSPACPIAVKREVRAMIGRQPASGLASGIRGMAQRPDRTDHLAGIGAPTLVIGGTDDAYIPSTEGQAMHRRIVGSRFVDIPGAGHLSNVDSTAAFNAAVETFLERLEQAPAA
jgi:pimeloyl-ACP methyl ester carboxylesterase